MTSNSILRVLVTTVILTVNYHVIADEYRVSSIVGATATSSYKQRYMWKTGAWGSCFAAGGCGEGRRQRQVWCAEPDGRTVLESFCDEQNYPQKSKECFTACRHHRDKLQWQVGSWGPCLKVSPAEVTAEVSDLQQQESRDNLGVTQRNVTCVLVSHDALKVHRAIDEENCFTVARKPDPVRFCHIPRAQDCVVGPFGDWSKCTSEENSSLCESFNGDDPERELPRSTRLRTVLVAPSNGGAPCPELTETRPCPPRVQCVRHGKKSKKITNPLNSGGKSPEYKLKVGEWRRCEAPNSLVSGDILATRDAAAIASNLIVPSVGADGDVSDVAVEAAAAAAAAASGNGGHIFPVSADGTSAEVVDSYFTFQPQVGYQTREVTCRDSKGVIVDISLCLNEELGPHSNPPSVNLPSRVRPCVVPQDCVVSQWSPWIRFQEGCLAPNGKARAEIHERRREVVRLQEGDGQPCPHLKETRQSSERDPPQLCAHKYRWLASKWSACVIMAEESGPQPRLVEVGCGGGIQLRDVTCVAIASGQPVASELCQSLEHLPTVQRCEVACPRDCQVGQWGPWGPCTPFECPSHGELPSKGYRERSRAIEVVASEKGLPCPSTREVQPCPQPACHVWTTGHWSSCQLDVTKPGRHCGQGQRTRIVSCTSLSGVVADESLCLRRQAKPAAVEPCLLPCPYDCVLSPWSEWSTCSHGCSSPHLVALRQRNRTVVAPPGTGGQSCPDPDEMMQIEPCNTHSCHGYSWQPLPWQPCRSDSPVTTTLPAPPMGMPSSKELEEMEMQEAAAAAAAATAASLALNASLNGVITEVNEVCDKGTQVREVWCVEDNERSVPEENCAPLPKPDTIRPCTKSCPVDCHMSPWSEWTSCPQQCVPDASSEVVDGEVAPIQSRRRVVLSWPAHGGRPCPSAEELRPCPLSAARCKHYLWGIGEWSDCQLPANVECGMGYRTRAVWCSRNHRSSRVSPSLCLQHGSWPIPPPVQWEPCFVHCKYPCVLSNWSPFGTCDRACAMKTRTRQLIGLTSSRSACQNQETFPLSETLACPCGRYTARAHGPWSDCIVEREVSAVTANGRPAAGVCGAGSRTRRFGCYDEQGRLVEPSLCGRESGLDEEPCLVPCPTDCLMGEWSSWAECSSVCGPGIQNRTRKVLREAENSGRPCGVTLEKKVCRVECSQYRWITGGWSECQLIQADREAGCGTGDQYHKVRCMDTRRRVEVADELCDPVSQPDDINACHVACPGDCVLGPWSDWAPCPKVCDASRERQRTRAILRPAASSSHSTPPVRTCPPLIEVQPCRLNVTCFSYTWKVTLWSSCLPLGGSPCGEGVQTLAPYCQRSDGRTVDDFYCDQSLRPNPVEKWCYVDCPVDCEVSSWSHWNKSECRCGDAGTQMSRYRMMVSQPSSQGRPCPQPLVQTKPCPALPCYSWTRGDWGPCDLHGAWCGHGTISRNVTCMRDNWAPVDSRFCRSLPALDLKIQASCYVPCRGDCQLSEWSRWSHCHRNCNGPGLGGYQTRSRAVLKAPAEGGEPCPTALWETRPCFSGPCLTFDWTVSGDGSIQCQRSDGVIVVGGCDSKPKPCAPGYRSLVSNTIKDESLDEDDDDDDSGGGKGGGCVPDTDSTANDAAANPVAVGLPDLNSASSSDGSSSSSGSGHPVEQASAAATTHHRKRDGHAKQRTTDDEIQSRFYYPKDDEVNVWMLAMIGIGCIFIIFVAVSIYLMWARYSRGGPGQYTNI